MTMAANRGYTIVEVLIVLAISTSLLFSAIIVFRGQQDATVYTQTVQDLNSKIINYADQVAAGTFPDSQQYICDGTKPRPILSQASGNLGGRQGCIFLGRAIKVASNSSTITVYTVLGKQTQSSGEPAASISQASPEPAVLGGACGGAGTPACWVMSDTFNLAAGAKIKKADAKHSNGLIYNDWIGGIYISLDQNGDTAGGLQQSLWGYSPSSPNPNFASGSDLDCIENTGVNPHASCTNDQIGSWNLCIQNANNSHSFLLIIKSSQAGITTALTDNGC